MKFITITILFALIASSLCAIQDEDKWCGSSVVSVEIISSINNQEQITEATITVPTSLEKSSSHINVDSKTKQEAFQSGTIIKKNHQGIVFTLAGLANSLQSGRIFEKDEDSDNDIYIPYSFIYKINKVSTPTQDPNFFSLELFLNKDFKNKILIDKQMYKVSIKFIADKFNTNICECMFNFFFAKINYNWNLRKQSLEYIRSQLFVHIKALYANYKAFKTIQGSKADLSLVEKIKIQKSTQETECSSLKLEYDMNEKSINTMINKMNSLVNPDCEKFEVQIKQLQAQKEMAVSNANNKIADLAIDMRMSDSAGMQEANSQVLEQRNYVDKKFTEMAQYVDALDQPERIKYDENKNKFYSLKFEYKEMAVEAEIKYLEDAKAKVGNVQTYFETGFWKKSN